MDVIVESGIDGATTREIARRSGYSSGVLSHYFERKDDILLEALRISHTNITGRLDEMLDAAVTVSCAPCVLP